MIDYLLDEAMPGVCANYVVIFFMCGIYRHLLVVTHCVCIITGTS